MRWDDFRRSDNVEDDRGGGGGGFGGGGLPVGGGGLGIGAIVVLSLVGWAFGIDPSILIGGAEMVNNTRTQIERPYQPNQQPTGRTTTTKPNDRMGDFVSAVLGNTEDVWIKVCKDGGQNYRAPRLRLFAGQVASGCGGASAASGPFYCPSDRRIYIDTSFFRDIENRFRGCSGKACEFAQAYVLAHEVGHHVQNQLGILAKSRQAQQAAGSKAAANRIQVQVELQADCFAGIWANQSNQRWKSVEPGDVEAALQTAAAIGDDTLQRRAGRSVVPDSFTHGSAAQRQRWFDIGFKGGKVSACNTFAANVRL